MDNCLGLGQNSRVRHFKISFVQWHFSCCMAPLKFGPKPIINNFYVQRIPPNPSAKPWWSSSLTLYCFTRPHKYQGNFKEVTPMHIYVLTRWPICTFCFYLIHYVLRLYISIYVCINKCTFMFITLLHNCESLRKSPTWHAILFSYPLSTSLCKLFYILNDYQ